MSGTAEASHKDWRPAANPWLITVVVTLAAFMEVLDTTIVNVSLPHIAGTMSASFDEATWALTAYMVANGIVLPMSAFLAGSVGRKRYFVICIVAFSICSLACGLSTNLFELIAFRALQGFFGGGLQPVQQSITLDTFPQSQRGKAFAVTAVAIVVAPVLGPTLGGWITDNFSWRWVFLINVPIGALTALAVIHLVEDPSWEKAKGLISFDFAGIGLIALGLGSLQVMLDRGEDDGRRASRTRSTVVASLQRSFTRFAGGARGGRQSRSEGSRGAHRRLAFAGADCARARFAQPQGHRQLRPRTAWPGRRDQGQRRPAATAEK